MISKTTPQNQQQIIPLDEDFRICVKGSSFKLQRLTGDTWKVSSYHGSMEEARKSYAKLKNETKDT